MMFKEIKDLYPTPEDLAFKMLNKVSWSNVKTILEPSAGLGDLISAIKKYCNSKNISISAIEIESDCIDVLISKQIAVIDTNFLTFSGVEQFDLIVANFPFSDGEKHLLKAIDVLFSGQIVCLLNAETIKNPYSNSRKDLLTKLNKLNADIEFIENAFFDAKRKSGVEVAMIYINKQQKVETELFSNTISSPEDDISINLETKEVITSNPIEGLVKHYVYEKEIISKQIIDFYKNYRKISPYLFLQVVGEDVNHSSANEEVRDLTEVMKSKFNYFSKKLKKDYWKKALNIDEVKSKLTSKKKQELVSEINSYTNMEFNEDNIRVFINNLAKKYPTMLEEAILYIFEKFTQYAYRDERNQNNQYAKNIHFYNGWKTNKAYKVNKKIIIPFYVGWGGINSLSWEQIDFLDDIDKVFSYFDTKYLKNEVLTFRDGYTTIETSSTGEIVKQNLQRGNTSNIQTRYFTISVYKKGTMHFTFVDDDILRRFNIYIGKKYEWLPSDYGFTETRDNSVQFESGTEYKQDMEVLTMFGINRNLLIAKQSSF